MVRRKLLAVILICLLLIPVVPVVAAEPINFNAEIPSEYELLDSQMVAYAIQFWHYSGGYWANNLVGIKLDDEDVKDALWSDMGFIPCDQTANLKSDLPQKVKDYLANGGKLEDIKIKFSLMSQHSSSRLFKTTPTYSLDQDSIAVSFKPIFRVKKKPFYSGPGMNVLVPQIQDGYGVLVFSIFDKNGKHLGQCNNIRPEDIVDSDGNLKSRSEPYSVSDGQGNVRSYTAGQIKIGWGTFANGGAVGLEYRFPIKAEYYVPGQNVPDFYPVSEKDVYTGQPGDKVKVNVTLWNKGDYGVTDFAWVEYGKDNTTWLDKEVGLGKWGKKDYTVEFTVGQQEKKYVFRANVDGKTPPNEIALDNNTRVITIRPAQVDLKVTITPLRNPVYIAWNSSVMTIAANVQVTRKDNGSPIPAKLTLKGPGGTKAVDFTSKPGQPYRNYYRFDRAAPGTYTITAEAWPTQGQDAYPADNRASCQIQVTRKPAPTTDVPKEPDIHSELGGM